MRGYLDDILLTGQSDEELLRLDKVLPGLAAKIE